MYGVKEELKFIFVVIMNTKYHLAQVNIGKILAPMNSPQMASFADNLDKINSLAEKSDGFVWRLKDDSNNATSIKVFDDDFMLINMSVWKNIDSLYKYVYQSAHTDYLKRRKEWFEKMPVMYVAIWYVPEMHIPNCAEAIERLFYLRKNGDTPFAFSFKNKFTPEEAAAFSSASQSLP
jgi:hypothetical protein